MVFDLGSHACRVGYSGEDSPKVVIQPVIGINKTDDYSSYYFSDVGLRYFKEGTKVNNVVGTNGASNLKF